LKAEKLASKAKGDTIDSTQVIVEEVQSTPKVGGKKAKVTVEEKTVPLSKEEVSQIFKLKIYIFQRKALREQKIQLKSTANSVFQEAKLEKVIEEAKIVEEKAKLTKEEVNSDNTPSHSFQRIAFKEEKIKSKLAQKEERLKLKAQRTAQREANEKLSKEDKLKLKNNGGLPAYLPPRATTLFIGNQ
jgi:hypothetical protein